MGSASLLPGKMHPNFKAPNIEVLNFKADKHPRIHTVRTLTTQAILTVAFTFAAIKLCHLLSMRFPSNPKRSKRSRLAAVQKTTSFGFH